MKWSRQLKLPDSGATASTLTTGIRVRSSRSSLNISAAISCSVFKSQCCLTDAGRPKHEDERIRFGASDCIHQRLFGFHKPRMCHRKDRNRSSRESESSGLPETGWLPSELSVNRGRLGLADQ